MDILKTLEQKAKLIVENVSNYPEKRYRLRYDFYETYGYPIIKGQEGLGNSELAFIQWEIKRGILNPITNTPASGSAWWRSVNSYFLYAATLAQLIAESGQTFNSLPQPVRFWLDYINAANEKTWYRAHNSSIIAGYVKANSLAFGETIYEQYFMNIVLYRLLYAQSMVEGVSFGILGKLFANPRGKAVSIITDIEAFYPTHYPLSQKDISYVMHKAHNVSGIIERLFDHFLILPHLDTLYSEASKWNKAPVLLQFVSNNTPIYPITSSKQQEPHFTSVLTSKQIQNN